MRMICVLSIFLLAQPVFAQTTDLKAIVEGYILPKYQTLVDETSHLSKTAAKECQAESAELVSAYHRAFDAWIEVSHLRFGPSEQEDRAFALAFWPDPRGSTPKTLAKLMRDKDPVVQEADAFATVSVAARGFYAMEFLLFDPQFVEAQDADYRCALIQAVAGDIARNAASILTDWEEGYGALIANPGNDLYRTEAESAQQIFTAISTGLEFTSDVRLGRPMGTLERPRPKRAEARRSGRSLRHVILSLEANRELTMMLIGDARDVSQAFEAALSRARNLEDAVFAGVATPDGRFRVEVLKQKIDALRQILAEQVGPRLGISAGFNSLDGD